MYTLQPHYRCPACQQGIADRTVNRCLHCGAALPAALLSDKAGPPDADLALGAGLRYEQTMPLPVVAQPLQAPDCALSDGMDLLAPLDHAIADVDDPV